MEDFANKINHFNARMHITRCLLRVFDHQIAALQYGLLVLSRQSICFSIFRSILFPMMMSGFLLSIPRKWRGDPPRGCLDYENQILDIIRNDPAVDTFVALSSSQRISQRLNYVHLKPQDEKTCLSIRSSKNLYKKFSNIEGVQCFIKNIPLSTCDRTGKPRRLSICPSGDRCR